MLLASSIPAINIEVAKAKGLAQPHKQDSPHKTVQVNLPHRLLLDYRITGNAVAFQLS
ncbi:hypothetical protein [Colwellia sp. TT2012]|uniref:hypothetical protein n=1 Tax=Colwellia sp. TT2012 TaxID=1720342 RepID=UPI000A6F4BE1|nr:hypothetical protein [Colwellia sp. TT2012]